MIKPILEINSLEKKIITQAKKISITTQERQWALIQSIKHIKANNIQGDIVECGVFRGGNIAIIKAISKKLNINIDLRNEFIPQLKRLNARIVMDNIITIAVSPT